MLDLQTMSAARALTNWEGALQNGFINAMNYTLSSSDFKKISEIITYFQVYVGCFHAQSSNYELYFLSCELRVSSSELIHKCSESFFRFKIISKIITYNTIYMGVFFCVFFESWVPLMLLFKLRAHSSRIDSWMLWIVLQI